MVDSLTFYIDGLHRHATSITRGRLACRYKSKDQPGASDLVGVVVVECDVPIEAVMGAGTLPQNGTLTLCYFDLPSARRYLVEVRSI